MSKKGFSRVEFVAAVSELSQEYDKEVANKKARASYQQNTSSVDRHKHLNGMTQVEWDSLFAGTD